MHRHSVNGGNAYLQRAADKGIAGNAPTPVSVHLTDYPAFDAELANERLVRRMRLVRGIIEKGRAIRSSYEIKNRQPLKALTLVPHSEEAREVAEAMRDLILEELNVEELHFAHDDSELARISAKPSFAGIKAKGTEYAKNMKSISAAISALDAAQIREIQGGTPLVKSRRN